MKKGFVKALAGALALTAMLSTALADSFTFESTAPDTTLTQWWGSAPVTTGYNMVPEDGDCASITKMVVTMDTNASNLDELEIQPGFIQDDGSEKGKWLDIKGKKVTKTAPAEIEISKPFKVTIFKLASYWINGVGYKEEGSYKGCETAGKVVVDVKLYRGDKEVAYKVFANEEEAKKYVTDKQAEASQNNNTNETTNTNTNTNNDTKNTTNDDGGKTATDKNAKTGDATSVAALAAVAALALVGVVVTSKKKEA